MVSQIDRASPVVMNVVLLPNITSLTIFGFMRKMTKF